MRARQKGRGKEKRRVREKNCRIRSNNGKRGIEKEKKNGE